MTPPARSAPTAAPRPRPRGLRALLLVHDAPRRQWPTALRTSASVAVPALVGWAVGDLPAGLLAGLGGFAALYGGGRPYLNRLRLLLVIAVAQGFAITLGAWAGAHVWSGVAAVALIAIVATLFCNAFNVQPGSYQIVLTCAAGLGVAGSGDDPLRAGLLVLAGGLGAAGLSLLGALADPHGPERLAVAEAAEATATYLDALLIVSATESPGSGSGPDSGPDSRSDSGSGSDEEEPVSRTAPGAGAARADRIDLDTLRHRASTGLHTAWIVLVNQQPHRLHPPRGLVRLREINRTLQLALADAMRRRGTDPKAPTRVRRLARLARTRRGSTSDQVLSALPLGRPSGLAMLRNAVQPGSRSLLIVARVAVAAVVAGVLGSLLGLPHAYWAIAAAVLVLAQGFDQRRTVQRGLERTAGTGVGLMLTALALALQPRGLLLIGLITVAVIATQLVVTRNYAAAAVFITCSALLTSTSQGSAEQTSTLLRDRGLDTALGCAVAILVFVLLSKKSASGWLPVSLADTLLATANAVDQLTPTLVTSPVGLAARRDLQRRVIRLGETFENGLNGFPAQRAAAERSWPVVVAAERVAYRVLAEGWRVEEVARASDQAHRTSARASTPPPSAGLRVLAAAVRDDRPARLSGDVPSFLSRDLADLRRTLQR